jgi:hypothetical protein
MRLAELGDYSELELPVEPKFKKGDWIACDADSFTLSIKSLKDGNYYFHQGASLPIKDIDEHYHLWTIADAKDGDVLATDNGWTCIFKAFDGCVFSSYCFMDSQKWFCGFGSEAHTLDSRVNGNIHPATKEQRELLFKKMKEAGYQWNEEKKELRKIQPHYDIANFHVGMPVLVRPDNDCCWDYSVFSRNTGNEYWHFAVCNGVSFTQCIPFEGNEHLLGTTDMCAEEFINWVI